MNQNQVRRWQNIIWREWRNCHDQAYARHLFKLVADTPVGWSTKVTLMLLNATVGATGGFFIAFIATPEWTIVRQMILAGGIVGAAAGFLAGRQLSWHEWLPRLAYWLPMKRPSRGLSAVLALLFIGGLVFGPIFLLAFMGLFWGMSGLIKWMNKGLVSIDPFEYYPWYFWWRGRPQPGELETALQYAYETQPAAHETWAALLPYLEAKWKQPMSSPSSEIEFLKLKK